MSPQSKKGGPGPLIGEGRSAVETNAPGFVVHLAKVAVDPDTGQVDLQRYVAIQDVGFALNPTLVEGQIHGGAVQGIGWGLHEAMVYDEQGQLLTGTFMDYDLPKAGQVPSDRGRAGAESIAVTARSAPAASASRRSPPARLRSPTRSGTPPARASPSCRCGPSRSGERCATAGGIKCLIGQRSKVEGPSARQLKSMYIALFMMHGFRFR